MNAPTTPDNEPERLAALRSYAVLDTPPDAALDAVVRLAAQICDVPIALVSLVDERRQWFKANHGLAGTTEIARDVSFCGHAILGVDMLEVADAQRDERFVDNPWVVDGPRIRFYAGVSLVDGSGAALGTLCVMDPSSRQLSGPQRLAMQNLSCVVVRLLEAHRSAVEMTRLGAELVADITSRKTAEEALHREKERSRVALHAITDGVVVTDKCEQIVFMNPSAERSTGWAISAALDCDVAQVVRLVEDTEDAAPLSTSPVSTVLTDPATPSSAVECVLVARDGHRRFVHASAAVLRGLNDELSGTVLVLHDIGESRERIRILSHRVQHDPLTGLFNRTVLEERLQRVVSDAETQGSRCALLFIDVDNFKRINDTHGHDAGDALLRSMANRLRATVRATDVVCRLSGDEFVIVLSHVARLEDAGPVAAKLLSAAAAPSRVLDETLCATLSIGIAVYPDDGADAEALRKHADEALYAAKHAGRNRFAYWHRDSSLKRIG